MKEFTKWILDHKKLMLVMILVLDIIFLFFVVTRFSISTDLISSFSKGFKVNSDYQKISSKYNFTNNVIVGIEKDTIVSQANLLQVYNYVQKLKKIKGVYYVQSFLPVKYLKALVFIDVNSATIKNDYTLITSFMKKINSDMYNKNSGIIFISFNKNANPLTSIPSILSVSKNFGYKVHLAGNMVMSYYIYKYIIWIIAILIPGVAILLILIFNFAIGNLKAAFLSVAPAGMAALWTFGFIFLTANSLSIITIIVPMFVIIMGSADGLHITSHFISLRSKFKNKNEAVIQTMDMVGMPVILTTITTILGFLSLTFTNLDFLRQMGIYTSVGIAFAGLISWVFLPIILSEIKIGKVREKRVHKSILIDFFILGMRNSKVIVFVLLFIAVIFALFIPYLKVTSNRSDLFKSYTVVVKDINFFKSNFGFANMDIIDFKTDSKNLFNPKVQTRITNFEKNLLKIKGVKKAISFVDIENKIKKSINNPFMEKLVIQRMLNEKIFPIDQWVYSNTDYKILLQINSPDENTMKNIEKLVSSYPNANFTGPDYVFYKLNQAVVKDQIQSLLTAVVMVFVLMWIIYKDLILALKSITPILYTLILFFGFLKITGFNLNIVVADVASIAIGIGIDYSIHFIGSYKYFNKDIKRTIESVGVPIMANAMGLGFGIMVLLFSPLKVHLYVSLSIAFTMFVSSLATMLILPIILKKSDK